MQSFVTRFIEDESGVSAIQYGLVIAILSLAIIPFLSSYASSLNTFFGNVTTNLN